VLTASVVGVFILGVSARPVQAQDGRNVLLVANEAAPESVDIAMRYASVRGVPEDQLLRVSTTFSAEISRIAFEREIQAPITRWLTRHAAQDRILFIVLTRGMPLRIAGTRGRAGTVASVDSELTVLYRHLTGVSQRPLGPTPNPYFAGDTTRDVATAFDRAAYDTYLVTRLDGFTAADALALIDRGATPVKDGRILLDQPGKSVDDVRISWFGAAVKRLSEQGFAARVLHEDTSRPLMGESGVLGYYSWGSNDPSLAVRHPNLAFVPGALAATFLSTDARTLAEPPVAWKPGSARNVYAGSSQSLAGDLVRSGVTGVAGQVSEPYLDGAVRPDILFPAYLAGLNLAEAFYRAMPYLSWQTVVFGDPLAAPFRTAGVTLNPSVSGLDPETELPPVFAARRLAVIRVPGASDAALKLMLRAEARVARSETEGAIEALERATALDEKLIPAWRALAGAYEQVRRYADANEAHRRVLALNPNDIPALNNLAYNLGVHENRPQEALPLAARAASLAKRDPVIDDTLGWIHHLLGDDQRALRLIEPAARARPLHATLQFHAAALFAAVGRLEDAGKALKAAVELDPSLKETTGFGELERRTR